MGHGADKDVAKTLIFPNAVQQAEATEDGFAACQEARQAYIEAWVHYRAITRL